MHEEKQGARDWVSVDEAYIACQLAGLDRTKKTIRSWARNEHVEAQKQITPTGERWMLEKISLDVKIRTEIEFQRQYVPVQTSSNWSEPVQTKDEPVQTRSNAYEHAQTGSYDDDSVKHGHSQELLSLRSKVQSLEIDKAVRDKQIEFLNKRNEEGQTGLMSQSRYIGHLETQVMLSGGEPDHRFLEAPIPKDNSVEEPEVVDPRQKPLPPVQ
jgi:hypothetical protein